MMDGHGDFSDNLQTRFDEKIVHRRYRSSKGVFNGEYGQVDNARFDLFEYFIKTSVWNGHQGKVICVRSLLAKGSVLTLKSDKLQRLVLDKPALLDNTFIEAFSKLQSYKS